MVDVVKAHGAGFVDYLWPKPGSDTAQPKVSYVAGYQPWGWIVGSGVYVDDVRGAAWADARSIMLASAQPIVSIHFLVGSCQKTFGSLNSLDLISNTGNFSYLVQVRAVSLLYAKPIT